MDKFALVVGSDMVINTLQSFLEEDSIEMRTSALKWILANLDGYKKAEV